MYPNGTAFRKAFPSLDLSPEVQALLDNCVVDRLIVNGDKTRMRIYITSDNWIGKRYIYEIEEAISEQIFENVKMEISIIERFRLSSQYTPKNFYRVYRKSMLLELKTVSPLLHQAFLHTKLEFDSDREVRAEITDSLVAGRRQEELVGYLDKVFCDRAGFYNVTVTGEFVENENKDLYAADDEKIRNRVRAVLKRSAGKAEKKDGEVEMLFEFSGVKLAGTVMVAFEKVSISGVEIMAHADINDEDQTIYEPSIRTSASDKETGEKEFEADGVRTICDHVAYEALPKGRYVLVGTLMNKETGGAFVNAEGKELTAEKEFEVTEMSGKVDVEFTVDAAAFAGRSVVVFEKAFSVKEDDRLSES